MAESCALCGSDAPLLDSHILPSFAFKALKKGSITGHIRHTDRPDVRVQDGITAKLLCASCEARFSGWEREFANRVYHPWQNGETETRYSEWMLKFCVSISWRVLKFCRGQNSKAEYTSQQQMLLLRAEQVWREFLLGHRPNPAEFAQQFIIFDVISSANIHDLPENINRFIMNAITMDIVSSSNATMTWAKLGQFQIFGMIQPGIDTFEGTKVHVRNGVLEPGRFVLPTGLLDLFREKALHLNGAMRSMSDVQAQKIEAVMMQNLDRLSKSRQFAAIKADAAMFGPEAVTRSGKNSAD